MARPIRRGIDYFSFDTDFFEDNKIKKLRIRYGGIGITIFIYILTQVYREKGYFKICDEDFILELADFFKLEYDKIKEIIDYMGNINLLKFTELTKSEFCITSERIQRNYQESVKTRAKKNKIRVTGLIWLLSPEETQDYITVENSKNFSTETVDI